MQLSASRSYTSIRRFVSPVEQDPSPGLFNIGNRGKGGSKHYRLLRQQIYTIASVWLKIRPAVIGCIAMNSGWGKEVVALESSRFLITLQSRMVRLLQIFQLTVSLTLSYMNFRLIAVRSATVNAYFESRKRCLEQTSELCMVGGCIKELYNNYQRIIRTRLTSKAEKEELK